MSTSAPTVDTRKPPRESIYASPTRDWWVEVVEDRSALVKHEPAWAALAANAVEQNAFYEPWMFLPAARFFETDKPLCCIFVYHRAMRMGDAAILSGFFPFERCRRFKGLPIRSLRLWEATCVLSTPLVHRDWPRETLHLLLDWIAAEERCPFIELPMIHGEGPFYQALVDVLNERRTLSFVNEVYTRALIRRDANAESYCAAAVDRESLRNWRRLRRRLSEQGMLETRVMQPDDDAGHWIEQFLTLEAKGWKGREKTALTSIESSQAIFRSAGQAGFGLGKLQMLGLFLNERPIALKCNYLSGNGGFTFKIAYDEAYAKFSPGVLLELDNIEEMHRRPGLEWLDSCAAPNHFMMNRIWKERRVIQNLLLATNRWTGPAIVSLLPMLRGLRRMIGR